ncbi:DeoR/GlpR family DNA-binding transcription regulator [Lactobacillus delbrueckii]|uniref:DeoR/GlpR family DNA-binding transcription regulator n=1 Tax=Lactobacillus delbrueckii TaxID=1584 RepID=UPI003995EAD7
MNQEARLREICQWLTKQPRLSTREIAEHFQVSFDTARRDILKLSQTGQALRVHGGVMALKQDDVPSYLTRQKILSPIKLAMAEKASHFIHAGQCDYIGPSTTLQQLCRQIRGQELQIITNSIDNALALLDAPWPAVTLLGGRLNKVNRYTSDALTLDYLRQIRFNKAFIACVHVGEDGIYLQDQADAEVIRLAVSRAQSVILVAEHYKFTSKLTAPYLAAPLEAIDVVITDEALESAYREYFRPNTRIVQLD